MTWDAVPGASAAITSTPVPDVEFVTFLETFSEDVLVSELPGEVESGFHTAQVDGGRAAGYQGSRPRGLGRLVPGPSYKVRLVPFSLRAGPGVLPASHWGEWPALRQALEPWQNVPEQRQGFMLHVPPGTWSPFPLGGRSSARVPLTCAALATGAASLLFAWDRWTSTPGLCTHGACPGGCSLDPGTATPVLSWASRPVHLLCSRTISPRILVPLPRRVSLLSTLPPTPSTVF